MAETCGIPFRVRRGTKTQLNSYGPLANGELGWTTDERLLYGGDGTTNYLIGRVLYQAGAPTGNGQSGQLYVDTTTSGIYLSNGSGWMQVGASDLSELSGNLDDISDGTLYQRVAATEVDASGYVIRLNDGSNTVTAAQARGHIDDATLHRTIDDLSTASTSLWSAQKINETIAAMGRGIDWQNSVLSISGSPPGGPSENDRYLVDTGTGAWNGWDDSITEYITASGGWIEIPPNEGFATWVEDEDRLYIYYNGSWSPMSSVTQHDYLAGLSGDGPEYYHLNAQQFADLTSGIDDTVKDIVGPMVSGTQTYITVTYDDNSQLFNFVVSVPHSATTGQTANDHHNQVHSLVGGDHTVTTVSGYVLKATSANTVSMEPITPDMLGSVSHNDLGGIGPNDHHNQQHSFFGPDHGFGVPTMTSGNLIGAVSPTSIGLFNLIDGGSF